MSQNALLQKLQRCTASVRVNGTAFGPLTKPAEDVSSTELKRPSGLKDRLEIELRKTHYFIVTLTVLSVKKGRKPKQSGSIACYCLGDTAAFQLQLNGIYRDKKSAFQVV